MDTKKLRQKILDLAIRGKLVPQDPNDEPASVLLERIRAEKERLIAEGKIKRPKKSKASSAESHYQNFEPPFEIPDRWEWVRLEDVAKIGTGATPSKSNMEYYGGNINWVSSSVTSFPYVDEPTDLITELALKETNCEIYPTGTLLMAMYGEGKTRGQVSELRIEAASNQACAAIIPYISSTKNFVKLYLLANYYQLRRLAEGGNQPNLNLGKISTLFIPLPPIQEQHRIVKQYEFILESIELLEASKALLEGRINLVKSKILDLAMQGKLVPQDPADEPAADMLLRINPKAKIITDNPHYTQLPDNWVYLSVFEVNAYKSSNIIPASMPNQFFDLYSVPIFSTQIPENIQGSQINSTKQVIKKGDVLLCKINPHLNRVWEITENSDYVQIASSEWIVVRSKIHQSTFLRWYFSSPKFRTLLSSQVSGVGGSLTRAQPAIVKSYLVPVPPMEEQKRISRAIERWFDYLDNISLNLSN